MSHTPAASEKNQPSAQSPFPSADVYGAEQLLRALRAGSAWLDRHMQMVNALNVFPVPDGDTGTNMSLTMRAALDEAHNHPCRSISELARVVAHGALMGARGNSGVILSQIMRGFARALDDKEMLNALDFAAALKEGAITAYKGVMKPVEGTILTVIREAAEAASQIASVQSTVQKVLERAVEEAKASLARTPTLLPVLAEAGVVDAGGQGLVLILEGMLRYARGESIIPTSVAMDGKVEHVFVPEGEYGYDTQFIIKGANLDVEAIREQIAAMGDSVLVVGDSETVKVHVHSEHPGKVLEYGISQGAISSIIIENMQDQYEAFKAGQPNPEIAQTSTVTAAPTATSTGRLSGISVIAVVSGEGLKRVFESLGVDAIVPGGQTMNPSTQDLLQGIENVSTDQVVLLPNNGNVILTARQAQELSSKQVRVIPTKTIPQGIAALLAFNYQADLDTNAEFMTETSQQVQTAEITRAVRSVQINGLRIEEGQIIGLLNGELTTVGERLDHVVEEMLQRMHVEEREIVTIYYGEDVTAEDAEAVAQLARQHYPDVEIEVLNGAQPYYYYIISAE